MTLRDRPLVSVVPDLTLAALRKRGYPLPVRYERGLRKSCDTHPPPFGFAWYGDRYRRAALDPGWLATSLLGNALRESDGSRKLWEFAGRLKQANFADKIRRHAIDESRHVFVYRSLLDIACCREIPRRVVDELLELSPRYTPHERPPVGPPVSGDELLDTLIQINFGEIRTRIHQLLQRPVLMVYGAPTQRRKLARMLASLLDDETHHIAYTARLIEQLVAVHGTRLVYQRMAKRMQDLSRVTLEEINQTIYD